MRRMNLTEEELEEKLQSVSRQEVEKKVLKVLERYTKLELAELLPIVEGIEDYSIIPLYRTAITDMTEEKGKYIIKVSKAILKRHNVITVHDYDLGVEVFEAGRRS